MNLFSLYWARSRANHLMYLKHKKWIQSGNLIASKSTLMQELCLCDQLGTKVTNFGLMISFWLMHVSSSWFCVAEGFEHFVACSLPIHSFCCLKLWRFEANFQAVYEVLYARMYFFLTCWPLFLVIFFFGLCFLSLLFLEDYKSVRVKTTKFSLT